MFSTDRQPNRQRNLLARDRARMKRVVLTTNRGGERSFVGSPDDTWMTGNDRLINEKNAAGNIRARIIIDYSSAITTSTSIKILMIYSFLDYRANGVNKFRKIARVRDADVISIEQRASQSRVFVRAEARSSIGNDA